MVNVGTMCSAKKWLPLMLVLLSVCGVLHAQDGPLDGLKSPDQQYSLKVLRRPHSTSILLDDCSIAVYRGLQEVSEFGTFGYLEDAFWSPDGKYVAVNNRRANSGDYLWVFRLSDGHTIKKPVDANAKASGEPYEAYTRKLVKLVTPKYPKQTDDTFRKEFTFATGWTADGKLSVESDLQFNHSDRVVQILQTFTVKADKLALVNRKIEDRPRGDKEF